MFHVDSGSLHHIENIGQFVAEFISKFRSERPKDFGLGSALGAMTGAVPSASSGQRINEMHPQSRAVP
jgi:oxalate decarboxylase